MVDRFSLHIAFPKKDEESTTSHISLDPVEIAQHRDKQCTNALQRHFRSQHALARPGNVLLNGDIVVCWHVRCFSSFQKATLCIGGGGGLRGGALVCGRKSEPYTILRRKRPAGSRRFLRVRSHLLNNFIIDVKIALNVVPRIITLVSQHCSVYLAIPDLSSRPQRRTFHLDLDEEISSMRAHLQKQSRDVCRWLLGRRVRRWRGLCWGSR